MDWYTIESLIPLSTLSSYWPNAYSCYEFPDNRSALPSSINRPDVHTGHLCIKGIKCLFRSPADIQLDLSHSFLCGFSSSVVYPHSDFSFEFHVLFLLRQTLSFPERAAFGYLIFFHTSGRVTDLPKPPLRGRYFLVWCNSDIARPER